MPRVPRVDDPPRRLASGRGCDAARSDAVSAALAAWREHWPEYLIEGWALGTFMLSAATFGVILDAPGSLVHQAIASADVRRALGGVAMGLTAVALIYSPWGRRSGAHMNPAVTLAFYVLGRMRGADAVAYAVAQSVGGLAGVALAASLLGAPFTTPPVAYVQTLPGTAGVATAFAAEALISFVLLATVLTLARRPATERFAGVAAGVLVALYIAFEAPLSGMSMNPARTLASAIPAGNLSYVWLYVLAPGLGMLAAAAATQLLAGREGCAKLRHDERVRCIHCGHEPPDDAVGVATGPLAGERP
jgi:aquaporin Z